MDFKKTLKFFIVFLIIFGWIFSGWPRIWQNPRIPPEIQEVKANTTGAVYPTLGETVSEAPWSDNTWTTPTNIYADDAATADVTAATFDSPDQTYVLKATGFDFSAIPDGSTINGIIARVNAWYANGAGSMDLCQLLDTSKAKVGTNNCSTAVALTTTDTTIITKGSASDLWGNALTAAWVKNANFGIAIGMTATAANADVFVDYVTLEIDYTPPLTTTIGSGTDPASATIAPGAAATDIDAFTFQTSTGTDAITQATTTFSADISAGISEVQITSDNGSTIYGTSTLSGTATSISLSGLTASTTQIQYKIRVVPKSHSAMSAPPGALYTATSTISVWTGTNAQNGSDSNANTLTIDNLSPNGATSVSGSAGDTANTINWTTSNSADFDTTNSSVILRWAAASAGSEVPTEGNSSYAAGNTIGTATVTCVISSAASTAQSKVDGTGGSAGCTTVALTNGQAYTYKSFQRDTYGNYDVGVLIGTFTPTVATVSCSSNISSTGFGTLTDSSISTAAPNASTTMTCDYAAGCVLYVKDAGSGSQPGLYKSTSPTYTIVSATATLSAGSDGYGLQATTTAAGSGGTLNINSIYNTTGNNVGGLSLTNVVLASSTAAITNREIIVTHKAAVSAAATAGSYSDTITYSCVGN